MKEKQNNNQKSSYLKKFLELKNVTPKMVQDEMAVIEDGTRVITQSAVFRAFGRTKRGRSKDDIRALNRPAFIDAKNLQPFIV